MFLEKIKAIREKKANLIFNKRQSIQENAMKKSLETKEFA